MAPTATGLVVPEAVAAGPVVAPAVGGPNELDLDTATTADAARLPPAALNLEAACFDGCVSNAHILPAIVRVVQAMVDRGDQVRTLLRIPQTR